MYFQLGFSFSFKENQIRDKLLLVLIFVAGEWQGYGIGSEREYTYSRRFGWMKIRRYSNERLDGSRYQGRGIGRSRVRSG